MVVLSVTFAIKPDHVADFRAVVLKQAARSRDLEEGCLRFDVSQDQRDETTFLLYEVYQDDAALVAHRKTPYFLQFQTDISGFVEGRKANKYLMITP